VAVEMVVLVAAAVLVVTYLAYKTLLAPIHTP
jgi:hypothetical protein